MARKSIQNPVISGPEEITNFNNDLLEQKTLFCQQVKNFVTGLSYGAVCCDEDNNLRNFQRKLDILTNYDTRDIYNCIPQTITFNEEFYNINYYEIGPEDLDLQSGYVQFSITEAEPTIEFPRFQKSYLMYVSGKDLQGNDIPEFTQGDIIRLKVETAQGTKWGVYLIIDINDYWMPSNMEYYITPLDYLSNYFLDTLEDMNNHLILPGTISKVNTIDKEYPYIFDESTTPLVAGRFNTTPGYPVNSDNILVSEINNNPFGETNSTWLNPVFNLEYPVEIYDTNNNNFGTDYLMLFYTQEATGPLALFSYNPFSNQPLYKVFNLTAQNTSRGVTAGGTLDDSYSYIIKVITSALIIIPEKCVSDTTNYNNISYTEIKKLLNS